MAVRQLLPLFIVACVSSPSMSLNGRNHLRNVTSTIGTSIVGATTSTAMPNGDGSMANKLTTHIISELSSTKKDHFKQLSKLPVDKQPYWFRNWKIFGAKMKNLKTSHPTSDRPRVKRTNTRSSDVNKVTLKFTRAKKTKDVRKSEKAKSSSVSCTPRASNKRKMHLPMDVKNNSSSGDNNFYLYFVSLQEAVARLEESVEAYLKKINDD